LLSQANRPDVDFTPGDGGVREAAAVGGEDVAASEPAGGFARVSAGDDRQASDVFSHDEVGGFAQGVVLEDDGGRGFEKLAERRGIGR
jgi:hypothetical protein